MLFWPNREKNISFKVCSKGTIACQIPLVGSCSERMPSWRWDIYSSFHYFRTAHWPSIFVHFGTCTIPCLEGLRDTIFIIKMGLFSELPVCGSVSEQSSRITAVECDRFVRTTDGLDPTGNSISKGLAALIMKWETIRCYGMWTVVAERVCMAVCEWECVRRLAEIVLAADGKSFGRLKFVYELIIRNYN